jgi:hypothetical protein
MSAYFTYVRSSNCKGKRFMVTLHDGSVVHFSHPDYRIKPGTSDGHNYCTRSLGIKGTTDPRSANYWARRAWGCRGTKSRAADAIKEGDRVRYEL